MIPSRAYRLVAAWHRLAGKGGCLSPGLSLGTQTPPNVTIAAGGVGGSAVLGLAGPTPPDGRGIP